MVRLVMVQMRLHPDDKLCMIGRMRERTFPVSEKKESGFRSQQQYLAYVVRRTNVIPNWVWRLLVYAERIPHERSDDGRR